MIESFVHFVEHALVPLGGWGVFLASFLEEIIAPIPSALILTFSGFIFLEGPLNASFFSVLFITVVLPASLGVTLGSLFVYSIAYTAGKPLLIRWGKWVGLSWMDVERLQRKLDTRSVDEFLLLGLRIIPIVPSVAISACYGLIRFDIKKYLLFTFIGTCVRATILALLGWQVGELYYTYAEVISKIESVILVFIILGVVGFVVYQVKKHR